MTPHIFRLLKQHQQLDEALRLEQRRRLPNIARLLRLRMLKQAVRNRLNSLAVRRQPALGT